MPIHSLPSDVKEMLLDELSPASLFKFGRTDRSNNIAVQSYVERHFRINNLLGRYFSPSEIDSFRQLQTATGAVISGSTVLQFFGRDTYPNSDLDIYMDHNHCEAFGVWLLGIGYQYTPRSGKSADTTFFEDILECHEGIERTFENGFIEAGPDVEAYFPQLVFDFKKENPIRKVQLVVSIHSPLESILNFHSTCVMNFITHDTAYSLFPQGTFEGKLALSIPNRQPSTRCAMEKYRRRGWTICDAVCLNQDVDGATFPFKQGMRYVGDSYCWSMPVLPKMVSAHQYDFKSNSWEVKYNAQRSLTLLYKTVNFDCLRFKYIVFSNSEDDGLEEALENNLKGVGFCPSSGPDVEERMLDDVFSEIMRKYYLWRSDNARLAIPL